MAYSDESDAIVRRLKASLRAIADEHTRRMAAQWIRAWDDVAPELRAALDELSEGTKPASRSQLIRSRRLTNALDTIERRLSGLVDDSAATAIAELRGIVDQAGHVTDQLVSSMLPAGTSVDGWARIDEDAVDAIVRRSASRIVSDSKPLARQTAVSMKRELVRGMLVGANPRETARRMVDRSERVFNGGLSRALVIARTEQLDAQRAGSKKAEDANVDVLQGWIWTAALGVRTCPSCWAKHGTEYPLDQSGPDDHQCGRCTRTPKTKSWKDLGFDIDEPASVLPKAEDRFKQLTPAEQLEVLGPSRYAAWRDGKFEMSEWTQKRTTNGWRDSWAPAPAPKEYRGLRRSNIPTDPPGGGDVSFTSSVPFGPDGEPMRRVLPTSYVSRVKAPEPAYRDFAPISEFTIASARNPRAYLGSAETAIADQLDGLGLKTLGVRRVADGTRGGLNKRPDVVTLAKDHRIEFKTLTEFDFNAVQRELRRGGNQARRVVLDMRGSDLSVQDALKLVGRAARSSVGRRHDEIGLLIGTDSLVSWSRYD